MHKFCQIKNMHGFFIYQSTSLVSHKVLDAMCVSKKDRVAEKVKVNVIAAEEKSKQ